MSVVTFVGQGQQTPPVLSPVVSQTINAGQGLLVTNTATDSDPFVPPETLDVQPSDRSQQRDAQGAMNGTSAVVTWRPMVAQAGPSEPPLLSQVTDSGSPPLSATNSFTITVNPLIFRFH